MRFAIPALLSGLFLLGCGPDFDPPSQLHSLRVLGVQKDKPYAQPGDTVNLTMLWEDASVHAHDPGRSVTVAWSPPCSNPKGDLYYLCFGDKGVFDGAGMASVGNTTTITIDDKIISGHPAPTQAQNAPYGITYIFFAVCAGTLVPLPPSSETTFPIGCQDASGKLLDSDDFVAGYASIYSFKDFGNHNPVISGFEFNGKTVTPDCLGDACLDLAGSSVPADIDCTAEPERCVPACPADGKSSCYGYPIQPVLDQNDPANQDRDDVSAKLVGRDVGEQMWIDYYTDAGGFKSPVRLLNDATTGWNPKYATDFYAPKGVQVSRVWTVVHDNRGGAAWAGFRIKTQ